MPELRVMITEYSPGFLNLGDNFRLADAFPHVVGALNILAHEYLMQWRKYTMGEPIPGYPRTIWSRGDYTRSINARTDDDDVKYIESTGPWTEWIEKGHGEIDLKPGLLGGPKARKGKLGPYNIVAFRHGTPDTLPSNAPMPKGVYEIITKESAKADAAYQNNQVTRPGTSRITGKGPGTITRVSGKQDLKRNYMWGYRLSTMHGGVAQTKKTSKGDYTWKTGKYTGMVRMDTSTSRKRSSEYLSFRVVSYRSDPASWIVPPMDPLPIRQAVIDSMAEKTQEIIKLAMEEDMK